MTWGERVRAWLTGRHEYRALVEVDLIRAAPLGGRPVPGTTCVEFTHVAYGPRTAGRLQAVTAIQAMLDANLPGARLLAVRDGESPRSPSPPVRLAKGPRPRLLLVGADTEAEAERLVERVSRVWGLPRDHYAAPRVPDRVEVPPTWQLSLAIACVAPLVFLLLRGGPDTNDELMLSRLFGSGAPVGQLAVSAAIALAAGRWIAAGRRGWSRRRRAVTAAYLLIPVVGAVSVAAIQDAVSVAAHRFPVVAVLAIGGLCVAAVPVGVSRIERPRLWAVLAWGLPLLAGGIAPFVGEIVLDYYLSAFQLSRFDVQVSAWAQWALGALFTGVVLFGVYVGVAFWVLFRRTLGPSPVGVFFAVLVAVLYGLIAVLANMDGVADRARLGVDGLPRPLPGLQPVAVCVVPGEQPYSYVGRAAPQPGAPAVYFGRADGRLAVWTAETGGVLLDGQQVALRVVDDAVGCG